jgi:tRNA dimethylallyltransferase
MVPAGVEAGDRLAVLCGPTAGGKTALAVPLAERMAAEIVCADSRTIYRGMDIGTAKPAPELRRRIPHHLLDVADPHKTFTLADYQRLARQAIHAIRDRGRLPLIVGGSGLYIGAVVDDLAIPPVAPDPALRRALETEEREHGPGHLHARLADLDPAAAARIHPRNVRRIVRALEVTLSTGRPMSEQQRQGAAAGPIVVVGLVADRSTLYARIDTRVDEQLAAGLVEEVRGLLSQGIPEDAPAMGGLGYKEIAGWLRGRYEYGEAVRRLKRNTRHFAKRQLTWFRRDPRIVWVDVTAGDSMAIVDRVHAIMDAELSP